jgi:glutamate transport system substrate-binding protein
MLVATCVVAALLGAACGKDKDKAPSFSASSTMGRIRAKGTMTVGVKFDQPGFGLKNPTTGKVEGFDVEIAKLIAKKLDKDLKIEFVESVSKNREPFIQDGKVDIVVATYTINDARKQVVDFAGPYFVAQQDIMVKSDNTAVKSVANLNGIDVCTAKGSTSEKNLRAQAPQARVVLFDTYSQCAEALTDGRVAAVTTDNTILAGLVNASQKAFKLVGAPFSQEPYGIGLKKGDDEFRTFLNDTLDDLFQSGDWAAAFKSTLGAIGLKTPAPPKVDRYTVTPPAPTSVAPTTATTAKP